MLSAGQRDRASSAKRLWAGKVAWSCSVSPACGLGQRAAWLCLVSQSSVGWDGEQRGRASPVKCLWVGPEGSVVVLRQPVQGSVVGQDGRSIVQGSVVGQDG